jgi:hypothetical protein
MDLTIIPSEEILKETVSLKAKPKFKPKVYEIEKKELPENIRKFDWKVKHKVYTKDPYSFNEVVKKEKNFLPTETASQMITNPTYNAVGKFLGVDTIHDWNRYYDKVYAVVEWARTKTGNDVEQIIKWIGQKSKTLPSVGDKTIDNLYIFARMKMEKK